MSTVATSPPATVAIAGGDSWATKWNYRRILRRPLAWFAWSVLVLLTLVLTIGPAVLSTDPLAQTAPAFQPIGTAGHLLGTDELGRDLLARLIAGGQPLLLVCMGSAFASGLIGSALGILAGYVGGAVDAIVMRTMDILLAFPLVLVAILMVALLGGGTTNMIVAITVSQIPYFARLARNLTLAERGQDYIRSAKALGFRGPRIASREILPNISGQLLVQATSTLAVTAGLSSALSYLGLGQDASAPDWGYMVRSGQEFIFAYPSLCLIPGLLITLFAVAANLVGDDLRDALDIEGR
ncbi:ABC transporter permease [Prescottella equi]|uniref:ABC transporter permease n=1 Tax=Rhodococcus hoagii TaxID=43767 RepID=UPI0027403C01|nr:ABC transporter permease [Prescottella equi]MDP8015166.1 ABC transporter permease [Prescottella equi]